jgi:uncharacterized protein (TIGR02300 family)
MATTKEARGTKRTCQSEDCEAKFYDLNRDPIVCPVCSAVYKLAPEAQEEEVEVVAPTPVRAKAAEPEKEAADGDEVADEDDALVSLEEADAELGNDDDDDDDEAEDTFLADDDEDDAGGVEDIIGGGVKKDDDET